MGTPSKQAFSEILYEVADGVATLTLDRPEKLNAVTISMAHEITAAFDASDADDAVRAVIVTGRGRGFCAGADLGRGRATFDSTDTRESRATEFGTIAGVRRDGGGHIALRIAASRKPVIAAINGPAIGVGATMTLPMDIRLAAESAKFGFVFTRRGLVPEAASSWFLPRVVGISQAMEWIATGRIFSAQEALAGGLVSRVVPDDDLLPLARAIAQEIAEHTAPVSVAVSRQLLWSMLSANTPWEAHRLESLAIDELGKHSDILEGVTAFLEKRPAQFTGRVSTDYPDDVLTWPARPVEML